MHIKKKSASTKKKSASSPRYREQELEDELNKMQPSNEKTALKSSVVFFVEIIKVVVISLAIIVPVRHFLIQPFIVKGASMEPNFFDHEYLIIDEISYRFRQPERGEVVVINDPRNSSQYYIKRIVGLPGEAVEIGGGAVAIQNSTYQNGIELNENVYLDESVVTGGTETYSLKDNQVWVMGDNRGSSLDSRVFGPVDVEEIVGRAWIRAWPFNRITHFTEVNYNL